MSEAELVLRSTRVITPEGIRAASIAVTGEKITAVLPYDAPVPAGARLEDVGDHIVLPGLVDTHVHVNDPGRTEWEGFWTATRAAAAGGITTLVDMPLNSIPPTTTVENLRTKRRSPPTRPTSTSASGAAPLPDNVGDLRPLHRGRGLRLQGLPVPRRAWTSSRTSTRSSSPGPSRRSPPSTAC